MKNITIDGVEYNITPVIKEIKKDYKILSLARFCSIKPTITDVSDYGDEFIEAMLKCDNARIYSVKRLSDGEIFTIGDIIDTKVDDKYKQEILEINLRINYNLLKDKLIFKTKAGYVVINIAVKNKQPLFTTEDGVDIFEGDNIYWVNINTFEKINCNKYNDDLGEISIKSLLSKKYECKAIAFSTKEKAEEYILMNKSVLSLNDINFAISKINNAEEKRNKLKTLVKLKIQQSV